MRQRLMLCCLFLGFATLLAQGQEPSRPSPEHGYLKKLAGTWDATMRMKMTPGENQGVMRYEMLGDFWVIGTFEGSIQGMKFTGKETLGFDPKKKKYVGSWIDTVSPYQMLMEGTFDPATRTMTSRGDAVGLDGNPIKFKGTVTWKDDDHLHFAMSEGKDASSLQETFTIDYVRRK